MASELVNHVTDANFDQEVLKSDKAVLIGDRKMGNEATMRAFCRQGQQFLTAHAWTATVKALWLTTEGRLSADAYAALERLSQHGLRVIAVTGRPAGWCDMIARFWPVDAVIGENGAFYFRYDHPARTMTRSRPGSSSSAAVRVPGAVAACAKPTASGKGTTSAAATTATSASPPRPLKAATRVPTGGRATSGPSARTVLLKGLDARGPVFYTNLLSRKGRDLAADPRLAIVFPWHEMARQVRIEGTAEPVSRDETQAYFDTRPYGSRIGAWASPQSEVVSGREELERAWAAAAERFPENAPVPARSRRRSPQTPPRRRRPRPHRPTTSRRPM